LEYYRNFKDEGFDDLDILSELNDADLDSMHIKRRGHRKKILRGVQLLKQELLRRNNDQQQQPPQSPPQVAPVMMMYNEFDDEGNDPTYQHQK